MENSHSKPHISALIFDLDGTLLNTEQLTKNILKEFLANYGEVQDNDKEKKRLGVTFKESSIAIVNDYHLPLTPQQYIHEILPMYHGKCEGSHENSGGWKERFTVILGSDQVKSGKPSPNIFLEAAKGMGVDPLHCLVIEDSLVGVNAGKAAGMKVVAVPSLQIESDSYSIADSILHSLLEFQPELWGLPQFEDWVNETLPIEPIHLSDVFSSRLLQPYADNALPGLPDQIWGLYIGWAKFDGQKVLKAVISMGWSIVDYTPKRKIQACIMNGSDVYKYDGEMQLLLVGYLQRSYCAGNILNNLDTLDEDKLTANAALNLPEFSYKLCKSFFLEDVEDDFAP